MCSVNIDVDMASIIIEDDELSDIISKGAFIRLEISEFFPEMSDGHRNPLLNALHDLCPLWLDDFGIGSSNLQALQKGLYERVKIDKEFFWKYCNHPKLKSLFNRIRKYSRGIVIEGIEKEEYLEIFTDEDVFYQGYLFRNVLLSNIGSCLISEIKLHHRSSLM